MRRFLLWDHDGVLVDTERWYFEATQQSVRDLGLDLDQATYLRLMSDGIPYWAEARKRGVSEEAIIEARRNRDRLYQSHLLEKDIEIKGVPEVLAQLRQRYRMAIVTTSKRVDFELIHQSRQIVPFFEFILTVEDCEYAKPHPDPYLRALARFQALPKEAIVIEDSSRGLKAACNAGLDCVVIRSEFTATQDFSGAWRIIDCISELPALLMRDGSNG
jgi:HAD superfamily hydrolase (TIGR01509 family)